MSDIYNYPKQVIYGNVPSKSNGYKIVTIANHASLAKTKAMKAYEDSFFMQCNQYRNKNIDTHFEFSMDVYYPTNKSDLDNSCKVVLDVLQHKVKAIKNDNKCVAIHLRKFTDKNNPRIEFYIKPA